MAVCAVAHAEGRAAAASFRMVVTKCSSDYIGVGGANVILENVIEAAFEALDIKVAQKLRGSSNRESGFSNNKVRMAPRTRCIPNIATLRETVRQGPDCRKSECLLQVPVKHRSTVQRRGA